MSRRDKNKNSPEVVVILPYRGNRVLMQLRDFKSDIVFPGQWGFFGGSIENGEKPKEAAWRELFEEISYKPDTLHKLDTAIIPEIDKIILHSFFCPLTTSVEELVLNEGLDFGLFTLEEIMTKKLFSQKMGRFFPVVPVDHIVITIKKLFNHLKENE
ncbi:NUDIX domain-containing protein [bacterium]|nr:NUDIX domain-containing protein [bacterium]MBU3956394.1 NUDIX domain-containing protein [bacterium]